MDNLWITGWWCTYPSEKYGFVNWDDEIPNIWESKTRSKPPISYIQENSLQLTLEYSVDWARNSSSQTAKNVYPLVMTTI